MEKLQSLSFLMVFLLLGFLFSYQEVMAISHNVGTDKFTVQGRGNYGPGSLTQSQCPGACQTRCSETQYHKPCMFFCQKCCMKCLCVPPGTYGNKEVCPCYNNWKTKRGGPKCP